jgi:hypothetical protein
MQSGYGKQDRAAKQDRLVRTGQPKQVSHDRKEYVENLRYQI